MCRVAENVGERHCGGGEAVNEEGLDLALDKVEGDEEAQEGLCRGRGRKDIRAVVGSKDGDVRERVQGTVEVNVGAE